VCIDSFSSALPRSPSSTLPSFFIPLCSILPSYVLGHLLPSFPSTRHSIPFYGSTAPLQNLLYTPSSTLPPFRPPFISF
jgi:hypothetical protein